MSYVEFVEWMENELKEGNLQYNRAEEKWLLITYAPDDSYHNEPIMNFFTSIELYEYWKK